MNNVVVAVLVLVVGGCSASAEDETDSSLSSSLTEVMVLTESDDVFVIRAEGVSSANGSFETLECPYTCSAVTDCLLAACEALGASLLGSAADCDAQAQRWQSQCNLCGTSGSLSASCEAHPCEPNDIACYIDYSMLPESLEQRVTRPGRLTLEESFPRDALTGQPVFEQPSSEQPNSNTRTSQPGDSSKTRPGY